MKSFLFLFCRVGTSSSSQCLVLEIRKALLTRSSVSGDALVVGDNLDDGDGRLAPRLTNVVASFSSAVAWLLRLMMYLHRSGPLMGVDQADGGMSREGHTPTSSWRSALRVGPLPAAQLQSLSHCAMLKPLVGTRDSLHLGTKRHKKARRAADLPPNTHDKIHFVRVWVGLPIRLFREL